MENNPQQTNNLNQQPPTEQPTPVAYDSEGNPLYATPQPTTVVQQPQFVHMTRSVDPQEVQVSPEIKEKHDESMRRYPGLNLSEHEYIVNAVRRHPIGLVGTMLVTTLAVSLVFALMMNLPFFAEMIGMGPERVGPLMLIGVLVIILFLLGGYVAIWVYMNNRFFLTNESVIQEIQKSLFAKTEQTVSLMNIEDASFDQKGPIQTIFNYGSIRLSTEGEETTYRFHYVANPKRAIAILNNAVEAFKNGRPVEARDKKNE